MADKEINGTRPVGFEPTTYDSKIPEKPDLRMTAAN
jgi:hypothetical protein